MPRKPTDITRVNFEANPTEKAQWVAAAEAVDLSLRQWLVAAAREKLERDRKRKKAPTG
jgi:hypothetical protein